MKLSKVIARKFVFPAVVHTGMEKLILSRSSNNTLHVLFHGVVNNDATYLAPRHMLKTQFEKHLRYFTKNFDVISISEAFERYWSGYKNKRKTITVSFDDGYRNNLTNALPLLEKYKIKTTFFISGVVTENTGDYILYSDILDAAAYFYRDQVLQASGIAFKNGRIIENDGDIMDYLKHLQPEARESFLKELSDRYKIPEKLRKLDPDIWQLMNKSELVALSQSAYVTIGSHGYRHYNLGLISEQDAEKELTSSKQVLEATIGKKVNSIAYPDGCYSKAVKEIAEKAGYSMQLAVNYRYDTDAEDKRILQRYGTSNTTTFESNIFFICKAFSYRGF